MTEEDDIGFACYYDPTGNAETLANMECVFPYIRFECSNVPISGSLVCENAGRCKSIEVRRRLIGSVFSDIIEFDNFYSWFSAKQLRYNIEIEEPQSCKKLTDSTIPAASKATVE